MLIIIYFVVKNYGAIPSRETREGKNSSATAMIYRSYNETHDTTLITTGGRVGELSLNITCHGLFCCKCLPTGLLWRHHLCCPHRETKDCAAPPKVCFDGILSDAKWNFVPAPRDT